MPSVVNGVALNSAETDSSPLHARIDLLNEQALALRYEDAPASAELVQQALALIEQLPPNHSYPKGEADNYNVASYLHHDRTEFARALSKAQHALTLYQQLDDYLGEGLALGMIGRVYLYQGRYTDALDVHYLQLSISETTGDVGAQANALNHLGNILCRLKKWPQCLEAYEHGNALFTALNDEKHMLITSLNICFGLIALAREEEALQRALAAYEEAQRLPYDYLEGWALHILGKVYDELDDYARAIFYARCQLDHARKQADAQQQLDALLHIAELCSKTNQYEPIEAYMFEAVELAKRKQIKPHQYRAHKLLADLYQSQQNFEQAFEHQNCYYQLKEQVFSEEYERKVQKLDEEYQEKSAQQEAEIYRLKTVELEKQVKQRTIELATINAELQHSVTREAELNQLKSRIIKTVSHEFRTPLTVINGSADLLLRSYGKLSDTKRTQLAKRVHDATFYLADLLTDVILVEQVQAKELRVELSKIAFELLWESLHSDLFNEIGDANNVQFEKIMSTQREILIDYQLLKQVLLNLVSNALKYSTSDAKVSVELNLTDVLTLTVQDNGIGIEPDEIAKIWELFYRGSNIESRRGLGLGLYIVKQLVESMSGTVSVVSMGAGAGSQFTVIVPIEAVP